MSLILNGTTGISDVDGTAAAPALTGTDTNTGIFFPAADTIAFAEGGAEAMRIDSSGNVGIGTTAPASTFHVKATNASARVEGNNATDATIFIVQNPTTNFYMALDNSSGGSFGIANAAVLWSTSANPMVFATNNTERARIDSSGNLLVGATSGIGSSRFLVSCATSDYSARFVSSSATEPYGPLIHYSGAAPNDGAKWFLSCTDTSSTKFQVRSNGGLANYSANNVNLSDRREKVNFAPAKSYLDVICAIPVQTFNYIDQNMEEDGGLTLGVVAQDLQAVAPEMVMESNWGTQEDPKMRLSIYQTDLQYALMKCIQEQQALITALTTRITALEAA